MTDDYEVGFGRPPKHSRFRAGESGNPKGRPKKAQNFKTLFLEEANTTITVREGGGEQEISKLHAVVKRDLERAIKGNDRAAERVQKNALLFMADDEIENAWAPVSAADHVILDRYKERMAAEAAVQEPKGNQGEGGTT